MVTHQTCRHTGGWIPGWLLQRPPLNVHTGTCPVTAGIGNRAETSLSGTATHHHTPGGALLVGPGDLLIVLVTVLGRTPRHSDKGQITDVVLEILVPQGFSEQTSAAVLLCQVSASES